MHPELVEGLDSCFHLPAGRQAGMTTRDLSCLDFDTLRSLPQGSSLDTALMLLCPDIVNLIKTEIKSFFFFYFLY